MAPRDRTFPLVSRRRMVGLNVGTMRSGRRGEGSDVIGSRPYRPGDDVDTIDWGASAKLSSARATDEFVVRVHYAEEAPRAIVVCDHRPSMGVYAPPLPWLDKHAAMRVAAALVVNSVVQARGLVGYLDYADLGEELWEPPRHRGEPAAIRLPRPFRAPPDSLTTALSHLVEHRRAVPPGSFVFVLSDFLAPPREDALVRALQHSWDVVPVVIQDPVWERSFPDVAGVVVRLLDPESGRTALVRLSPRDVQDRRAANERRLSALLDAFRALDLDPIELTSSDPVAVLESFLAWSDRRKVFQRGRRW